MGSAIGESYESKCAGLFEKVRRENAGVFGESREFYQSESAARSVPGPTRISNVVFPKIRKKMRNLIANQYINAKFLNNCCMRSFIQATTEEEVFRCEFYYCHKYS